MAKPNELVNLVDMIKMEFIYKRKSDGSLHTINELANKYGIPATTLYDVSKRPDIDGFTWIEIRNNAIAEVNSAVSKKLQKDLINAKSKVIKSMDYIIDLGLDGITKSLEGWDFKKDIADKSKRKLMTPNQLTKMIELKFKLMGKDSGNLDDFIPINLNLNKSLESCNIEELDKLGEQLDRIDNAESINQSKE